MIDEILKYNKEFVEEKKYEQYKTSKYPDKKIAIITCMDTRLTELLPAALGIRNGDVKIIKNAGGVVSHAFGSVVRSVLVGIFELGIEEVMVIGHTDCGVQHINSDMMIKHMMDRGVDEEKIELIRHCGIDFDTWLEGFDCVESSVKDSVEMLRKHPLIPKDVKISGYVMDSVSSLPGQMHGFHLDYALHPPRHPVPPAASVRSSKPKAVPFYRYPVSHRQCPEFPVPSPPVPRSWPDTAPQRKHPGKNHPL